MKGWKKFMAVSCSHGHLADAKATRAALEFKKRWKPDLTLHLGDAIDLAALRAGAMRNPDAGDRAANISEDFRAGLNFLRLLEPQVFLVGNHEFRLYEHQYSPNAIVSHCATSALAELHQHLKDLRCQRIDYDIERGWKDVGGTLFGHGFMYSAQAVRDHVESLRKPIVIGHLHRVDRQSGRSIGAPVGWTIGCLANIGAMGYARRNRSTLAWQHGIAWGEYNDHNCIVNVLSPTADGEWRFPI
jgi:predicted phosphodiesterase